MTVNSDLLERLATEAVKVRGLITDAHTAVKDLRHYIREARSVVKVSIEAEIERQLKTELDKVLEAIRQQSDQFTQTALDRYDKIITMLEGARDDDVPMTDLMLQAARRRFPPKCPGCGLGVDGTECLTDEGKQIGAGDMTICLHCAEVSVVLDDGIHLRMATADELGTLLADPAARRWYEEALQKVTTP